MSNVKEKMTEVIQSQPDDASYEEIMVVAGVGPSKIIR